MIDLEAANGAFEDSVACRVAATGIDRWVIASRESAAMRRLRELSATLMPAERSERLRWWAMTLGWTMLAHLVAREALPRYAVSGLPWWWNVAGAGFAFAIAATAQPISTWWQQATVARLWRGLTG